jgi:coenzyme F420 hydrogenase subunit beta
MDRRENIRDIKALLLQIGSTAQSNIEFVVEHSLCHGGGTCEAVCPENAIVINYVASKGVYLPSVNSQRCTSCTLCVQVCSGFAIDLGERPWDEDALVQHPLVGPHISIYRAYSTNKELRQRAASGGLVTEIAIHLLEKGEVDGVIAVRMSSDNPLLAEVYIANNSEELIASQKSKYCPVPLNRVLREIIYKSNESSKKLLYIGLPQHVHGLRLAQRVFPQLKERIPLVVSIFTAHVPSQRATEFILYKQGIKKENVASIEYRGGGNPGRMRIVTKEGYERFVPHFHWTYSGHSFPLFFYPVREWLYFDKISEWADIVCGDNWMGGLSEQNGVSTVIVRSKNADRIVNEMKTNGRINSSPMSPQELVKDQELTKKLNIGARLNVWKKLGHKIPFYTRKFTGTLKPTIRTWRFALNVLISEVPVPFPIMNLIIWADYNLRSKPMRFVTKLVKIVKKAGSIFLPYHMPVEECKEERKIVLIGGYGHKDIGDEAMPHAVRLNLKKRFGDSINIVMLSVNPESTEERHGERSRLDFTMISNHRDASIKLRLATKILTLILLTAVLLERKGIKIRLWKSAREALDELSTADVVLNVGGGNVNSVIPVELYKKCTTYLVASILGKPVFLSGQTMGPFYGWYDKTYAKYCLNKVNIITFRDKKTSHQRLHEIGVTKPIMFDAADDAITLNGIDKSTAVDLIANETCLTPAEISEELLIFMNMKASLSLFKGIDRNGGLESEVELMAKIADALLSYYRCRLVFVGTDYSDGVDDRVVHMSVISKMKKKNGVHCLQREYSDIQLVGMIGCADLVIGGRYHFNVFAASQATPFIGLASGTYQMTKLQGLAALCELPQCFIDKDMEYLQFDEVWPLIRLVVEDRDNIKLKLKQRIPFLKISSLKVYDEIERIIYAGSKSEQV